MQERRVGSRYNISFPVNLKWKDENGNEISEDGLTENVGQHGTLIYLPRTLPKVGNKVSLTVREVPEDEMSVTAQVIRLERNAAHPQAALQILDSLRWWKKSIFDKAAQIISEEKPEEFDEW